MSRSRLFILVVGPIVIVGFLYWTTMPSVTSGRAFSAIEAPDGEMSEGAITGGKQLATACRRTAAAILPKLNPGCRVIVRPPYVLAGDMSKSRLERHLRETIIPTARALSTSYFDRAPDEPIIILMFTTGRSYRQHAVRFDGEQRAGYHGYYQRDDRRIVLNIATGNGTLAHELTHALAHFDFPGMPEWFDEGLASLQEQSEFSDDGLRLVGLSNWRLHYLLPSLRRKRLKSLERLMAAGRVQPDSEAVDYAHARYFCLYLQKRRLLSPFYRKLRAAVAYDSTGIETLRTLVSSDELETLDRDFRNWVVSLHKPVR